MKLSRVCLFALPAALSLIACGSSSSGSGGSGSSSDGSALSGTYVPVGDSASKAEFAHITFSSGVNYSYTRASCSGSGCNSVGTYTFDGDKNLELTDGTTGSTEHVDFEAQKYASGSSLTQSLHVLDGLVNGSGGSIVNGSGGSLTNSSDGGLVGDGGSLLSQILQALMNGIEMALQNAGSDGGSGDDDSSDAGSSGDDSTDSAAPATDAGTDSGGNAACTTQFATACVAAGGNFSAGGDGSCSCVLPDGGASDAGDGGDAQ